MTESPAHFSAVNFQKVLELLAQTKKEQHNMLIANKEDLLDPDALKVGKPLII